MGIKPLYFCHAGSDLLFGSEIKAILEDPVVERQIDINALNCFLRLNYVPAPYTMVRGIEKLDPGHVMEWTDGQTRSHAYWQPTTEIRHRTLENAKDEMDRLLPNYICKHLISVLSVRMF